MVDNDSTDIYYQRAYYVIIDMVISGVGKRTFPLRTQDFSRRLLTFQENNSVRSKKFFWSTPQFNQDFLDLFEDLKKGG